MSEPQQPPEPAEPEEERDPLKRRIAVTLAVVVLLGGGLAILQTDASVQESNTARETTRVAVRALRANVSLNTVAGDQAASLPSATSWPSAAR